MFWQFVLFITCLLSGGSADDASLEPKVVFERDLVLIVDFSVNMKPVLQNLINGAARFIQGYDGRSNRYNFVAYYYNYTGPLVKLVNTTNATEFLVSLARLRDSEAESCPRACCCSVGLEEHLPVIARSHSSSLMILVLDCYVQFTNLSVATNISDTLRRQGSQLYAVQLSETYCRGTSERIQELFVTDSAFLVSNKNLERLFEIALLHVNSYKTSDLFARICKNMSITMSLYPMSQAVGLIAVKSERTQPVQWFDPKKVPFTGNIETILDDEKGALIQMLCPECPPSWIYSGGKCFLRESTRMSWFDADAYCRNFSATLFIQTDGSDEEFLKNSAHWNEDETDVDGSLYWTSLTDHNRDRTFAWSLLKSTIPLNIANYQPWASNESLGFSPGSRCVAVNRRTSTWSVRFCRSLLEPLCIKPAYGFDTDKPKRYLPAGSYSAILDSYDVCHMRGYNLY